MIFYLGTHKPHWLWDDRLSDIPLFVSHRTLRTRKKLQPAKTTWALDSGGFSELSLYGRWDTRPDEYVASVERYSSEIGGLQWAAIQDWMCEPQILKKTGRTLQAHQRLTITSYLNLMMGAPHLPWVPVIQGWQVSDYLRHIEMYRQAGVDLSPLPLVGVGSVCRRQATAEGIGIFSAIHRYGVRNLHGFGVKSQGRAKMESILVSADSMAWSFTARKQGIRLPDHTHSNCANCMEWALMWREKQLDTPPQTQKQMSLF